MKARSLICALIALGCSRVEAQHAGMPGMSDKEPTAADLPATATPAANPTGSKGILGYAHVALSPVMAKRLDLTTAAVAPHRFTRQIRAYGVVMPDETRTSHVHAKVRGWLEEVPVNFTGREVQAGEVLATIYSPEVYSAQLELLSMLATPAMQGDGEFVQADRQVRSLTIAAAKRRLQLWDVPKDEIRRLLKTRQARRTFTLHAPRSGTVVAKQALIGLYADTATELYTLSDLSRVWVEVDVVGRDALHVKLGEHVVLTVEGVAEPLHAPITFVAPSVDEATRAIRIRFELDNAHRQLRPGAFATAQVSVELGESLGVPEEAVMRTGTRNLVFVVLPAHVEPREIQIGESAQGWLQVKGGLQAGEIVATNALFLLDSESRIRASSGQGHSHGK